MRTGILIVLFGLTGGFIIAAPSFADVPISEATQECIDCHEIFHPGIVSDWRSSRHAATTVGQALSAKGLALKVSSKNVPTELRSTSVGCAECHTLRNDAHADAFEHNGTDIHVVVTPDDCATCHRTERVQFADNIMAHAYHNLADNTLYNDLQRTILGKAHIKNGKVALTASDHQTRADACYYCHGTRLTVTGSSTRDTDAGELEFPVIKGWPNQGVGRINPDGSKGACSACHTRHQFSIEMARKPYTCKECHVGPDVPAFKVYSASKHGNIFSAMKGQWDFKKVPWTIGADFTAPTCAACHVSLLVNTDGDEVASRTHAMKDRLGMRLFGLIYAHRQPKSPDTTIIRNKSGLSLPTDFDGTPAASFLISDNQVQQRRQRMQQVCLNCHDTSWVGGYFSRLDNTIARSNEAVQTATTLMQHIWQKGYAQGPAKGGSPFDEYIERRWSDAWLLYANNVRFVSAMAGGGDYGVFENGRYHLTKSIFELQDWLSLREKMKVPAGP